MFVNNIQVDEHSRFCSIYILINPVLFRGREIICANQIIHLNKYIHCKT